MLRIIIVALVVILVWLLVIKLIRDVRAAKVDWVGWGLIVGFIALAFYLRETTGIGGI